MTSVCTAANHGGTPATVELCVPPAIPAVHTVCTPLKRGIAVHTVMAKASTPFALTRSGGTPMPSTSVKRRKARERVTGRPGGGPACIGCAHYVTMYVDGYLTGWGTCSARNNKRVAARDRRPCGLYDWFAAFLAARQRGAD